MGGGRGVLCRVSNHCSVYNPFRPSPLQAQRPSLNPSTSTLASSGSVAAAQPGASFAEQLAEKGSRHAMLLACLAESAVLHRLAPEVQRVLLDNAEKLEVATSLLGLQVSPAPHLHRLLFRISFFQ